MPRSIGPSPALQPLSRETLRKLLARVLPSDADLEAFCLDHFPDVSQRFAAGMTRTDKITLLLNRHESAPILAALRQHEPDRIAQFEHIFCPPLLADPPHPQTGAVAPLGKSAGCAHDVAATHVSADVVDRYVLYRALQQISHSQLADIAARISKIPGADMAAYATDLVNITDKKIQNFFIMRWLHHMELQGDTWLHAMAGHLAQVAPGIWRTAQAPSVPAQNPFHTNGPLPHICQTYVARECDLQLRAALQISPLIVLWGEWSIGKTSLLNRVPILIDKNWICVQTDLMGWRSDNINFFTKKFFRFIASELTASISDWEELVMALERTPALLLLDELGRLNKNIAKEFIPKLCWLGERARANVRIVATMPNPMDWLGINRPWLEPKYTRPWRLIHIKPCNLLQIDMLMSWLPRQITVTTDVNRSTILDLSGGLPLKLQCLCARLFNRVNHARVDRLVDLITKPTSYDYDGDDLI